MKAILLSVKPKWCELIASGIKTIEVRKTDPTKLETPFKVYIYCTAGAENIKGLLTKSNNTGKIYTTLKKYCQALVSVGNKILNRRVIGEFVCNEIEYFYYGIQTPDDATSYFDCYEGYPDWSRLIEQSQVPLDELLRYGNKKGLFGWHISDLVIYDEPKKLSEFKKINRNCYYSDLGLAIPDCEKCKEPGCVVQKAPQSWCYVEELERA